MVILTKGWLGMPPPEEFDIAKSVLQQNPWTLFTWSPIYVTGNTKEQHIDYMASGTFFWVLPNLLMVDRWDLAWAKLPQN